MATAHIPVDQFPTLQRGLYANHAAISPWPLVTTQAVQAFAEENSSDGPENYKLWLRRETRLRRSLAQMLNAVSADEIALLKNTTEGICTVANGIDWQNGDNLIIPVGEFPSNRLPWLALKRYGVEVREVDIRSTADPEQALLKQMDGKTRLLAISAVQWSDGLRLQMEILGAACRQQNVLFFVDAIQQLGAQQIDVQACAIDFLAADGHKWLLAPEGIAVFYCRKGVQEALQLRQHGWHMLENPYQFNRVQWEYSSSASRFEAGSPNMLGQAAMLASVGLLLDFGMERVAALIGENTRTLTDGLRHIRATRPVRAFDEQRVSGIVSFEVPGRNLPEVYRELLRLKLNCSLRGNAIRLSPHFYQAGKPVQDMLQLIEEIM